MTATRPRADAPCVRNLVRGTTADALAALKSLGIEQIIADLENDRYAASSANSNKSHVKTWSLFHFEVFRGANPIPPVVPVTVCSLIGVASLFKAGGYRSYPNYQSAAKSVHVEAGHDWTQLLDHTARWVARSVLRGIGPARQSCPFRFEKLCALPQSPEPLTADGPHHPQVFAILASIFMLREIEASTALIGAWTVTHDPPELSWLLPSSKSDHLALGVRRTWPCVCGHAVVPCPYHMASKHLVWLATSGFANGADSPLFPTTNGKVPSKASVASTFEALGELCGQPTHTENGVRAFGAHSARVTGAQTFAAIGIEINKIRLMARHSGDTIMRYVSDAPLRSLRADLGLVDPSSTASLVPRAARSRTPPGLAAKLSGLEDMIKLLNETVSRHATELARAHIAAASSTAPTRYVQNTTSAAVHAVRANNDSQTVCGWSFGLTCRRSRLRRTSGNHTIIESLSGVAWQLICKNCLPEARAAAAAQERATSAICQSR